MLRRVRWLLLVAILLIAGTVGVVYKVRRDALAQKGSLRRAPLPQNTTAVASGWEYEIKSGSRSKILVRARRFEQIKEPAVFILYGLEMEIRQVDGPRYDLVKSEKATFEQEAGRLIADGAVDITMGLSRDPAGKAGRQTRIRTSGVSLDVQTSRVATGRAAEFEFDRGSGRCRGAVYDPAGREILMQSEAELDWRGAGGARPPLHVEASRILYREVSSDVVLTGPTRLVRGTFELRGGDALVRLGEGGLPERVETAEAAGGDILPSKRIDYQAGALVLWLAPGGEIRRIEAARQARLDSVTPAGRTRAAAERIDMEFEPRRDSSELRRVVASGKARIESRPAERKGAPPEAARILTSEAVELLMRPGGEEIERAATHAPGQIEFPPARPADAHRTIRAERFTFSYGAGNRLESCRAVGAETRTAKPGKDGKPVVALTRSEDLLARFDAGSGQMTVLEQWGDFSYQEGSRNGRAEHATYGARADTMVLEGKARVWDESGSTAADRITLDQKEGVMVAEGGVTSVSEPAKKKEKGGLLAESEPLNARAARMTVSDRNRKVVYEGGALLWQAETRLEARRVRIDRQQQLLEAEGAVVAEVPDERGAGAGAEQSGGKKTWGFTVIRAPAMVYTGQTKVAVFSGGTGLERQALRVKSSQLRACFTEEPAKQGGMETRLDRLVADGAVEVRENSAKRTLDCSAGHSVYLLAEERMELAGGNPVCSDSLRGTTRGAVITWYGRQDKMVVDNTGAGPAVSRVKQKE